MVEGILIRRKKGGSPQLNSLSTRCEENPGFLKQEFGAGYYSHAPKFPESFKLSGSYAPRWMLVVACCLFSFYGIAQPKAFATLKPERVETGDTISLMVIVTGVPTEPKEVDFIAWNDAFPISNILSRTDWRKSGSQWIRQFKLIAFDSATLELPPLTVLLPVGKPLTTNALSLTVFPTPGKDLSDMEPIRDIYREPVSWMDYWPWAAGGLLVIIIVFRVLRRIFRRPKPVIVSVPVALPAVSARDTALQKLQELQSRQLWKTGALKEHYAELSLIVREYLETNYGIAALESTTVEIMSLLTSTGFSANLVPLLRDILNKTDMVKYAQSQPPESTHEAVIEKARELITPAHLVKHEPKKATTVNPPKQKPKSGKYEPL